MTMPFPLFEALGLLFEGGLHLAANATKEEAPPRKGTGEGRCPSCLGPLSDQVVKCGACDAPHHAGCYATRGGCALAGCSARGE